MAVLCLLTNTPWPWPTPAGAASARGGVSPTLAEERKRNGKGGPKAGLHKRGGVPDRRSLPDGVVSAEDWGNLLSRARDGVPQEACLPCTARQRHGLLHVFSRVGVAAPPSLDTTRRLESPSCT